MDQHGGTAGLVTIEDLFEEVVGDIEEGRGRARRSCAKSDGRVRVRGTVRLDEAGEALGRPLEHPKVTTVSGLVLLLLGRPAHVGDVVTWNNVRIEVTAVAGRGVAEAAALTRQLGIARSLALRARTPSQKCRTIGVFDLARSGSIGRSPSRATSRRDRRCRTARSAGSDRGRC